MSSDAQDIPLSELTGFEHAAAIIAGRPLQHFTSVHSFHYITRHDDASGDSWNDIELVMEEAEEPYAQVGIKFHRVAEVEFSGFSQIMGLCFQDIHERGMEKLGFEVDDYEDGNIHLYCYDISVFKPGNEA